MLESIPAQQTTDSVPTTDRAAALPGGTVAAAQRHKPTPAPKSSQYTTAVYIVALLALLVVAQAETPRRLVYIMFGFYLAAAAVWVGSQYLEIRSGSISVAKGKVIGALIIIGLASIGIGALFDWKNWLYDWPIHPSTFIVLGVLAVYLGLGYGVARMRARIGQRHDVVDETGARQPSAVWVRVWTQKHRGALIGLAALSLVFALGAWLLGDVNIYFAAALLGVPVVGFPWILAVLSEYAIGDLHQARQAGDGKLLRGLGLGGVVLALIGGVVAAVWGGSPFPFYVMFALAALIFALTSSTLADIAIVLGLVALMGVTPSQDPPLEEPSASDDNVLIALGDSYMSGEGAQTFIEGTDEGDGNECRRASTAWAVKAGRSALFDGVIFLACSGADTYNVRKAGDGFAPPPENQTGEPNTQLAMYDALSYRPADPALVVMSIGGNDAGFATIGLTCLAPGDCDDPEPEKLWRAGNLDRVENRLRQVYEQVDKEFDSSPVAIIPYPDPMAAAAPCPDADLTTKDVKFIRTFLTKLNERIKKVADDYGFHYVDDAITSLKRDHLQLCDDANEGNPGLNFIGLRSVSGLPAQRFNPTKWHHNSLHPNKRGHEALYRAFERWLESEGGLAKLPNRTDTVNEKRTQPATERYDGNGDCSTFDVDGDRGCKALSTAWAFDQTGKFVLERGIVAVAVIAGAWLASAVFFASRRRRPGDPAPQ